jgi:hypothetical protein
MAGSEASVVVREGSVVAHYRGIDGGKSITVDGATISATTGERGVSPGPDAMVIVTNSAIHGFTVGIDLASGQARIRGSDLGGNGIGVRVADGVVDLGSVMDSGGNTLSGSTQAGLVMTGSAFGVHEAVGNVWIPFTQGTDAAGHFPLGTTVSGPFGASGGAPDNVISRTLAQREARGGRCRDGLRSGGRRIHVVVRSPAVRRMLGSVGSCVDSTGRMDGSAAIDRTVVGLGILLARAGAQRRARAGSGRRAGAQRRAPTGVGIHVPCDSHRPRR